MAPSRTRGPSWKMLLGAAGLIGLGALAAGIHLLHRERAQLRQEWEARLSEMAEDRREAIEIRLEQRLGEARLVASYPTVIEAARRGPRAFRAGAGDVTGSHLADLLRLVAERLTFQSVHLLDTAGGEISVFPDGERLPAGVAGAAAAMLWARASGRADFFMGPKGSPVMVYLAPVRDPGGMPKGAIALVSDAARWYYPALSGLTVPSETCETVLLRREGDRFLLLTPLRDPSLKPLIYSIPADRSRLAGRLAVDGVETFGEFVDYRRVPVYAATRRIGATGWGLVAKIDVAEALAPYVIYRRLFLLCGLLLLGALAATAYALLLRQLSADMERRVGERTAELAAANEELESFSYAVSHDLRAPLRGIDGWSFLLLQEYETRLDDTAQSYLRMLRTEVQSLARLVDSLLQLSRAARGKLVREPVDLGAMARDILDRLKQREPARDVEVVIGGGLQVTGDPTLLKAALQNILDNAWKFTSQRAGARIEVGSSPLGPPPRGAGGNGPAFGTWPATGTCFYVRDNGAGFDPDRASTMFQPFQRFHAGEEYPGVGIGLATVQRIVRRHGGQVWAEGKEGGGATFFFHLGGGDSAP